MIRRLSVMLASALLACDGRDVTVFTAPDPLAGGAPAAAAGTGGVLVLAGGAGGQHPGSGGDPTSTDAGISAMPCRAPPDCPPAWACEKQSCRDQQGVCQPRPVICDSNPAPVCGCDHVTYWNDCIRAQYGMPVGSVGECMSGAASCNVGTDCRAPGASCSHLLPAMFGCPPPGPGTCWVTPFDCSTAGDQRSWVACPPPNGGGGPPPCKSTCEAIQSGRTFISLPPGAQCAP